MQTTTVDFGPQTAEFARIVAGIRDDQLAEPTPCAGTTVAALLDHVVGLTLAFRLAAEKTPFDGGPSASEDELTPDWRTTIPAQLAALAEAWRRPEAWDGLAEAGGVRMPAAQLAMVALDELVVHGWDLAVATGQEYRPDGESVRRSLEFAAAVGEDPEEREGLFGPVVPVPEDAPLVDRLLGRTGRDPGWSPPG